MAKSRYTIFPNTPQYEMVRTVIEYIINDPMFLTMTVWVEVMTDDRQQLKDRDAFYGHVSRMHANQPLRWAPFAQHLSNCRDFFRSATAERHYTKEELDAAWVRYRTYIKLSGIGDEGEPEDLKGLLLHPDRAIREAAIKFAGALAGSVEAAV